MAGLPQVGLEAIIEGLAQFQAGAASIQKAYESIDQGANQVQKTTSGFSSVFSSLGSSLGTIGGQFVGLGQSVLKFGAIAGSAALVGVAALGAGIVALGASAVTEFAKYERMSLSIQNLVAREISQGQVVEQQIQTRIGLTQKETEELSKLPQKITDETLSRQTLAAKIQEQQQKIIQLTAAYGDNGLNVQVAKARLAEMENEYVKSGTEIDTLNGRITELNSKNNDLATTLQKVRVGQMSMSDAMQQAGPRAQELLKWIQLLAIQSPFTQEGVAVAFQTALTYGFTTQQAQRLTQAMIDFTSATGKGESVMNDVAYALGQIEARGKVTQHELRMLGTAGIGVNRILEDMGMSLDDVTAGNVNADKFIEAVTKDMEIFTGAGKQQATTFSGLFSTLSDIKSIGLREFFTGTFKAIQPYLANFANTLSDMIFQTGSIRSLGDALGQSVGNALAMISNLVAQFQRWGPEGIFAAMGFSSSSLFIASVKSLFDLIAGQLPSAQGMFEGFSSTIAYLQANLFPMLTQAVSFVIEHFVEFKGALIGIGAVLGAGVFAALVAGLVSLLSPINLIIAAAALLGAAWAGDWYGIQEVVTEVVGTITNLMTQFQAGGLFGSRSGSFGGQGLLVALGLDQGTVSNIQSGLITIQGIIGTAGTIIMAVFNGISTAVQPSIANIQTAFANLTTALGNIGITWSDVGNALLQAVGYVAEGIGVVLLGVISVVTGFINGLTSAIATGTEIFSELTLLWQQNLGNIEMVITGVVTIVQGFMRGTWSDIWTGAGMVLQGFILGVIGGMATLVIALTAPLRGVYSFMSGFVTGIADFWRGLFQTLVGASIIPDMITSIIAWFNTLTAPIMAVFNQLSSGITSVLGTIFGVLGSGSAGGQLFDTQAMIAGLLLVRQQVTLLSQAITSISSVSFPMLTSSFLLFYTTWITQLPLMQQSTLLFDTTIQSIYLLSIPTLTSSLLVLSASWISQFLLMQQQVLLLQTTTTAAAPVMSTAILSTGPAITTVTNLVSGLSSIIAALKTVATTAANGIKQAFLGIDWKSVGVAIGNGIMDGLESKANDIKRMAEKVAEDALEAAKSKLGISSPSQVFFEVGQEIVNGMTQGILSLSSNPVKAATSMIDKIFSALSPSEVGTQASQFAQAFATPLQGTLTNLQKNIDLNKASLTASLNFLSDKLGRTVTVQDFPELRQMLISNTIPNNPIANNIENALDAQNELNAAMEEQARIQGQLSALQTQQQQFAFLQKQIELVDFLTKQGLNAAQVLKGIPLGVGANASNLLAAMQATIEASISKMNQQLAGIPTGAAAAVNAPVAQTPTVSTTGNTNSTNYNFQMTVNSGASAESVIQQFNIAKAMLT